MKVIASSIAGRTRIMSSVREMALSAQRPKYPATRPSGTASASDAATAEVDTNRLTRKL